MTLVHYSYVKIEGGHIVPIKVLSLKIQFNLKKVKYSFNIFALFKSEL